MDTKSVWIKCRKRWSKFSIKSFAFVIAVLMCVSFLNDMVQKIPNDSAALQEELVVQAPVVQTTRKDLPRSVAAPPTVSRGPPNTMVLTSTNTAFIDFTENWLASILSSGVWPNITVVAEDEVAYAALQKRNDIRVLLTHYNKSQTEKLVFDTPSYKKFVNQRPTYIKEYLQRGTSVLFSDVDIVWLDNPFPYFDGDYDIYLEEDQHKPVIVFCAGFVFFRATEASLALINELINRIEKDNGETPDQVILNDIINEKVIPDLKIKTLRSEKFPNGKLFFDPKWRHKQVEKPVVVHNNWIVGHDTKIKRFKDVGYWFIPNRTDVAL